MSACPKCGCQVESPFDGVTVIHDVEKCCDENLSHLIPPNFGRMVRIALKAALPEKQRRAPSRKQSTILEMIRQKGRITLDEAVDAVGAGIYTNKKKHVGALLSNMANRGMIQRVRKGVFEAI